jgi:hypothetical protein
MKEPSKQQIKDRAKILREVLREKHKIELPHGHALEVLAKVFGFNDWNTASALAPNQDKETEVVAKEAESSKKDLPFGAKLPTAGELADFFAKFERDKPVFVNEYKNEDGLSSFGTMTSVCSITYDQEIQNGKDIRLELNTEAERKYELQDFGKSASQKFDQTAAGRLQRRNKFLYMQNSFWNPQGLAKADSES